MSSHAKNQVVLSRCYQIDRQENQSVVHCLTDRELPADSGSDVLVRIEYSSLNYKDALAARGHPGVVRRFPLVPGIDAVGTIQNDEGASPSGQVILSHADFGTKIDGGWSQWAKVPVEFAVPLPEGLTPREAMILGTAGFTAAQCVLALIENRVTPESGPIIVTGATGGVGILAVKLLSHLGYHVVASSGKPDRHQWLMDHRAAEVIGRFSNDDARERPLASAKWAGAVDTVGGETLAAIIRATRHGGCVTACGVVGGADLPLTVYPFILRGVRLIGIDSANVTQQQRQQIWQRLAGPWRLSDLDRVAREVDLDGLDDAVQQILAGQIAGRVVVRLG